MLRTVTMTTMTKSCQALLTTSTFDNNGGENVGTDDEGNGKSVIANVITTDAHRVLTAVQNTTQSVYALS